MSNTEWVGVSLILLVAVMLGAVFVLPAFDDGSDCDRSTSFYDTEESIPGSIDVHQQFDYPSLSPKAQRVFDRAREDGRYTFADGSKEPSEFLYSDETKFYAVTYGNQTDYLATSGCDP